MPDPVQFQLPSEGLGPPGLPGHIHIVPQFAETMPSDEERLGDRTLREFKLQALLSKFPPGTESINGNFTAEDGSSFLVAGGDAVKYRIAHGGRTFELLANSRGELTMLDLVCQASSFADARTQFLQAVNPWIDFISFSGNIPVYIVQLRAVDSVNQITHLNFTGPTRNAVLNSSLAPVFPELEPVYALYREARNATSLYYRFLSYFKIMEGFRERLSKEIYERAKGTGIEKTKDVLPAASYIDPAYQSYVGASVWKVYDAVFNPEFRIAVAHFGKANGDILTVSDFAQEERYTAILPVIELCVRVLIEKYNTVLSQLYQLGK